MSDFPFDIVGFDLDGTLVDSALDIDPAVNKALAAAERDPVDLPDVRAMIGGGTRKTLERALEATGGPVTSEKFERLHDILFAHYSANIAVNTRAYDGCLTALDALTARGVKLAVVTNKAEDLALSLLDQLGLTARFASIVGGDTLGRENAKPAPHLILETITRCGDGSFAMVGDSTFDVKAARNAGVPVVTFSFGYHDVPPAQLGGDVLIDHFDQLIPALEDIANR